MFGLGLLQWGGVWLEFDLPDVELQWWKCGCSAKCCELIMPRVGSVLLCGLQ